jgi:hypothetical protein
MARYKGGFKMNEINELRAFQRFLGAKLENGGAELLPEEALDEWRQLHPEPWDDEDDVAAIQAAIDDVDAGEKGVLLEVFMREMSEKFNLPGPTRS